MGDNDEIYGEQEYIEEDKIRIEIHAVRDVPKHYIEFHNNQTVGDLKESVSKLMNMNIDTFRLGPRGVNEMQDTDLLEAIDWGTGSQKVFVIPLTNINRGSEGGGKRRRRKSTRKKRKSTRKKRKSTRKKRKSKKKKTRRR